MTGSPSVPMVIDVCAPTSPVVSMAAVVAVRRLEISIRKVLVADYSESVGADGHRCEEADGGRRVDGACGGGGAGGVVAVRGLEMVADVLVTDDGQPVGADRDRGVDAS